MNADGSPITRNIEEIQEGDYVLSRDQFDAGDDIEPKRVEQIFRRTSDHVRTLTVITADGQSETIQTTDEHPFWLEGTGWTNAGDLMVGQQVDLIDGADAMVASTHRTDHANGITLYNFEVTGDHTYFVADGDMSFTNPLWVHNMCVGGKFIARIKVGAQGDRFKGIKIDWGGNVKSQAFKLRSTTDASALQAAATGPKRDFVKSLGQDPAVVAALKSKGVSQSRLNEMIVDGKRPPGWEVHHKKPIQWGGDNSQDNFILLPANPHHRSLTDEQGILTDQAKLLGLTDQPGSNEFEMTWVELPGRFMLE